MMPQALRLLPRRHILQGLCLVAICHIISIYTIDSPKPIYHCPLDRDGLSNLWADENCYWSTSYAEAREKFISLGNRLKEQLLLAKDNDNQNDALDLINVQSISYDISNHHDYELLKARDIMSTPELISPGENTVDAILLTVRVPSEVNNENVNIIHSSGTHGIEGYLGSAVQLRFLHELFMQNEKQLNDNNNQHSTSSLSLATRRILLIHAINPYGMRHHRRTNENNVDLNRNALTDTMWTEIRKRDPNFVNYVSMDSTLNPFKPIDDNGKVFSWVDAAREGGFDGDTSKMKLQDEKIKNTFYEEESNERELDANNNDLLFNESTSSIINTWFKEMKDILKVSQSVIVAVFKLGYESAKRGLVAAQYHKPSGLSYGGGAHNNNTWENSIFAVQHAINQFAGFRFDSSSVNDNDRTIWVDVHTGLGGYGKYSVLTKRSSDDNIPSWTSKFNSLLERKQMGYGKSKDASVNAGYDQTKGFIVDDILCSPPNCHGFAQEFGTRPGIAVAVSLIVENMGYHNSVVSGRSRGKYSHLTSWAFYPQRLSWRRETLRGGMQMIHTVLDF